MLNKLRKLREQQSSDSGFTIIEVMIVLAIAGLIILIVFLAVPALQRNSHNTQRKNDVQNVLAAVTEYESNNSNALPGSYSAFSSNVKLGFYQGSTAVSVVTSTPTANSTTIYVVTGYTCSGNTLTSSGASTKSFAAYYQIETTGGFTTQCQAS